MLQQQLSDHLEGQFKDVHDRLGYGTLVFYKTMKFMIVISAILFFNLFVGGIAMYHTNPGKHVTFSWIDEFSMANMNQSSVLCMQQYVSINSSRIINCGLGGGFISNVTEIGVVPANVGPTEHTFCGVPDQIHNQTTRNNTLYCS